MSQQVFDPPSYWPVGSLPPEELEPEEVQPFIAREMRPEDGDVVTDGEVRLEQRVWIVFYANLLAMAAGLTNIWRYSSEVWHFAVRLLKGLFSNRHMTADDVPAMQTAEWAIKGHKAFEDQGYSPGVTYKVELASPVAYKMFSGAMYLDIKYLEDKIVEEIWKIHDELGPEKYRKIKLQLSVPFELWWDALKFESMEAREQHYAVALQPLERIIERSPEGTRFAFHICWGDLGGKPAVPKWRQRVGAKIAMMNAIIGLDVWKSGKWILDTIHDPFGDGKRAPRRLRKRQLALYAEHLRNFPEGTAYAAGILHERYRRWRLRRVTRDFVKLRDVLATKGVTKFYLSTHCGLGRKKLKAVLKIFRQYHEIKKRLARVS